MEFQHPEVPFLRPVAQLELIEPRLKNVRPYDDPVFAQGDIAQSLYGRVSMFGAVNFWKEGWGGDFAFGSDGLFREDSAAEGDGGSGQVGRHV